MAMFMQATGHGNYGDLWQWSVDQPEAFWSLLWDFCGAVGEKGSKRFVDRDRMPGARWFPEARLNYAENLLQNRDDGEALVFWGEDKVMRRMTRAELYAEVARFQVLPGRRRVSEGDRVAGYLPNLPETLVAMLATTALGAIWSSASPGFRRPGRASTASARSTQGAGLRRRLLVQRQGRSIAWPRMPRSWRKCRRW